MAFEIKCVRISNKPFSAHPTLQSLTFWALSNCSQPVSQFHYRSYWLAKSDEILTIIFSTIVLVSPSRSESFEFSGWILVVSILGWCVKTCGHHWWDWIWALRDVSIYAIIAVAGPTERTRTYDTFSNSTVRTSSSIVYQSASGRILWRTKSILRIVQEESSLAISLYSSPSSIGVDEDFSWT